MAQKGGAVTSHIRIGPDSKGIYTSRLSEGMADVLIACDMIVGSGQAFLKTARPGKTAMVLNTDVAPTGEFQSNKNMDLGEEKMRAAVRDAIDGGPIFEIHGTRLATELTGDSIGTNVFMLGYAAQKGLLPVSIASIQEAIRLNGTFVEGNLRTFALGRLAAHDPEALAREVHEKDDTVPLDTVEDVLASRTRLLTAYQNASYAARYRSFVDDLRARIAARSLRGGEAFVREVALTLARLMAYKDEYEVARLYSDTSFVERVKSSFDGDNLRFEFHLAPPLLARHDPATGEPKKMSFGPWMLNVFGVLSKFKFLRGTPLDPFGYSQERRIERQLIADYENLLTTILAELTSDNHQAAVALAALPEKIRGYGPIKQRHLAIAKAEEAALREQFHSGATPFLKAAE